MQLVFKLFREKGTAYGVVQHFSKSALSFPKRAQGAWSGKLTWTRLTHMRVLTVLKNPAYAGIYVFGRHQNVNSVTPDAQVSKNRRAVPMTDWHVFLPEHHEGYITVEEFHRNRQRLASNRNVPQGTVLSGAAREGLALLQGLLMCSRCGRSLMVRYQGNGGIYPCYECRWELRDGLSSKNCFSVRADLLDDAVSKEVLEALKPAELELAMAAVEELEQRDHAVMRQWQLRIERAEYECALAERRYEEVDPSNRLVAASLERRWNDAMSRLEELKAEAAQFQAHNTRVLTAEQRTKILSLARDLPRVWQAPTTQPKDRKRMLRLLIADITVENLAETREVALHIRWQGGACTDVVVKRPLPVHDKTRYPMAFIERVREMASRMTDEQILNVLNAEGVPSAKGGPFTINAVRMIRYSNAMPTPHLQRPDEITIKELANELGVSTQFVRYWMKRGVIKARQIHRNGTYWITLNEQELQALRQQVRASRRIHRCD